MADVHDECGIAGVFTKKKDKNVAPLLYKMLLSLQNRGQLSAGISTYSEGRDALIRTYKELGTVNEVFQTKDENCTNRIFREHAGHIGIGHVRYSTFGLSNRDYAHPFERYHGRKYKWFSFCFNGNLANFDELRRKLLEKKDYHLIYNSDTEIIMHYIAQELCLYDFTGKLPDLAGIFANLSKKFDGAYSIAYMDAEGRLAAIRDPHGIKPLCYSMDDDKIAFASEDVALKQLGLKRIMPVPPGEMLIIENNDARTIRYSDEKKKAHCMFEYVYFANAASNIEGRSVYESRFNLGREMAGHERLEVNPEDFIAISVPDSSKPFGEGYAYALGLPHKEGLLRNRFVGRTFIEGNGRQDKIKDKFSILPDVIKGKKVILLDDSIIRGNTSKMLVDYIRKEGGAKEIHLRVSCPPVISPCFYGIDMSTLAELVAYKFKESGQFGQKQADELGKELGVDSLVFQETDDLVKAIGLKKEDLCLACLDSKYPTEHGERLYRRAIDEFHKTDKSSACEERRERVLVIGSGGREHAIAYKIKKSKDAEKIYCIPGNGGTAAIAENVDIDILDNKALAEFAEKSNITLTIVGPEAPLVNGIVNEFEARGLKIFGPRKAAAMLEGSKAFSKEFMIKNDIPTSRCVMFTELDDALEFIRENRWARVVKADGLAAGKGVFVCDSEEEAIAAATEILGENQFGESGRKILVEERLEGEEATFMVFSDGRNLRAMPASQDHKRIFEDDKGPNTGGMGAYAPAPILTKDLHAQVMDKIAMPTIRAMERSGTPYKGILYIGLMITSDGPKVLEYNCRFGDPEAEPLLLLLKTDLSEIANACIDGTLDLVDVQFYPGAACSIVMASKGYPGKVEKGKEIHGLGYCGDAKVFHCGTRYDGCRYLTSGGRVLAVTAIGKDIQDASRKAYSAVSSISFEGCQYRKDIARRALKHEI